MPECENSSLASSVAAPELWQPEWAGWALPEEASCTRYQPTDADALCHEAAFDNNTAVACEEFVYQTGSSIVAEVGFLKYPFNKLFGALFKCITLSPLQESCELVLRRNKVTS